MNTTRSQVTRNDYRHNTTAASRLLGISRQRVMMLIELGKLDAVDASDFGFRDRHHYAKWRISESSIQERIAFVTEWRREVRSLATGMVEVSV